MRRDAGADVPAAQIAHHALAAARAGADPQPAWEAALEAAREASAALGHAEAAAHYAEALEALALGAEAPASERREAMLDLAEATICAGDIEEARRRYSQAAAAARRDGDAEALARAALGFAQVRPYGAIDEESVTLLSQALERLEDGPLKVRVTGLLSVFWPEQARREALIDEALASAADEATRAWLWPAAVIVNWRPERAARSAPRPPRRRCASRSSTPITARWCGRTCSGSATRCRPATSRARSPTSTARGRSPTRPAGPSHAGCCCSPRRPTPPSTGAWTRPTA